MKYSTSCVFLNVLLAFACGSAQRNSGPKSEIISPTQRNWSSVKNQGQKVPTIVGSYFRDNRLRQTSPSLAASHEFIKTPNFDVLWLSEEPSNPEWKKYSSLFAPSRQYRQSPAVKLKYLNLVDGIRPRRRSYAAANGHNSPNFNDYDNILAPSPTVPPVNTMTLNRYDIESILGSLGQKKHILVLRPRKCNIGKANDNIEDIDSETTTVDISKVFENHLFPKFLQQLPKHNSQKHPRAKVDQVLERIFRLLNNDDKKIITDLYKAIVSNNQTKMNNIGGKAPIHMNNKVSNYDYAMPQCDTGMECRSQANNNPQIQLASVPQNGYYNPKRTIPKTLATPATEAQPNILNSSCDRAYIFQVENRHDSFNDLLLKVMKIVEK